jgi:hypothetical protein
MQGKVSVVIAEIQKNPTEIIRVSIEEFRGSTFVDCRVFWKADNGEWRPSKKGIALNAGCIDPVIEALQKASKALDHAGTSRAPTYKYKP